MMSSQRLRRENLALPREKISEPTGKSKCRQTRSESRQSGRERALSKNGMIVNLVSKLSTVLGKDKVNANPV